MKERYVLRNVKRITGQRCDLVIEHGRIADMTVAGRSTAERIIDCSGLYVSSGWIDSHVHAFAEMNPYGDEIDEIGVKQGVTTVIDAGSCGADQIRDFMVRASGAATKVLAYLNISRIGLSRIDECSDMRWLDRSRLLSALKQHGENIVGLKARISKSVVGENGLEPLRFARQMARDTALPLMVHIGSGPPDIREILALLERGDVITHYLHGKTNGLFDRDGKPLSELQEALNRGVRLDVGHGSHSFSLYSAQCAKQHRIPLGTISSDIYRDNRLNGPVYSLAHVMTKFLNIGYPLDEVIAAVTSRVAERLHRPELSRMGIGDRANVTLFKLEPMESTAERTKRLGGKERGGGDASYTTDRKADRKTALGHKIKPVGVVIDGQYMACEIRT